MFNFFNNHENVQDIAKRQSVDDKIIEYDYLKEFNYDEDTKKLFLL